MKKSFAQEYAKLTPTNQKLFRSELMTNFNWTTPQSFYNFIRGNRNTSNADLEYVKSRFVFYFRIQKDTGRFYLPEYTKEKQHENAY